MENLLSTILQTFDPNTVSQTFDPTTVNDTGSITLVEVDDGSTRKLAAARAVGRKIVGAFSDRINPALHGYNLKELLFTCAISVIALKKSERIDTRNKLLLFFNDLKNPNASLVQYKKILLEIEPMFGRSGESTRLLFNTVAEELGLLSADERKKRAPDAFNDGWHLPLYNLNYHHFSNQGDLRTKIELLKATETQAIYLLNAIKLFYTEYAEFKESYATNFTELVFAARHLINSAPKHSQVSLNVILDNLENDCRGLIENYFDFVEDELRPLHNEIPSNYIIENVQYERNQKAKERSIEKLNPMICDLAICITATSQFLSDIQLSIEQATNKITYLSCYANTIKDETTELDIAFSSFCESKTIEDIRNDNARSYISDPGKAIEFEFFKRIVKTTNEIKNLIKQQDTELQIFNLATGPILRELKSQANSNDLMTVTIHSLKQQPPISSITIEEVIDSVDIEIEAKSEDSETLQSGQEFMDSLSRVFQHLARGIENVFAQEAANRVNRLIQVLRREIDDQSSAISKKQIAEHLSSLLIHLSLISEQVVTTMRLEQANPTHTHNVYRLASHNQSKMVRRLHLPLELKQRLLKLTEAIEWAEIHDRNTYDAVLKYNQNPIELLLQQVEEVRITNSNRPTLELRTAVYEFVGDHLKQLSNIVSDWTDGPSCNQDLPILALNRPMEAAKVNLGTIKEVQTAVKQIKEMLKGIRGLSKKPFNTSVVWESYMLNATRYLELALARIERANYSNNPSGFFLGLHRYLTHASLQVAIGVANKNGFIDLDKTPPKELSHSLWDYAEKCKLTSKPFTASEQDFMWASSKLNNAIRYLGETLHTNTFSNLLNAQTKRGAGSKNSDFFIKCLLQEPIAAENEWQKTGKKQAQRQRQRQCQTVCKQTFTMIQAASGVMKRFYQRG